MSKIIENEVKMNISKIKNKLIGDRAFYSRVIAILLPMIIQNTVTNVVSLLDNIMVGRVGTLQMSAVAIVNQLIMVLNLCIFGALAGIGIFAAQYYGAGDEKGFRYCFRAKTIVGVAVVAISSVVFYIFSEPMISIYISADTLQSDAQLTLKYATEYLRIMIIGLLPFAISQVFGSTLREMGETKLPMVASVTAIFVNLIFNYLLIFGSFGFPKLGVAGAAIATVMSRYVETIILIALTVVHRKKYVFIIGAFKSLYVPKALCVSIVKKGTPLFINEFLWSLGMAVLLQCYSVRGIGVVAAANISNTVNNLFSVVFLTMGSAVAIILGQYLGANEIKKAKDAVWKLLALAVAVCVVIGGILAILSPFIPHIYKTEPAVRELATKFLLVVALLMPVYAFAHNAYFTIRSGGRTIITFLFDSAFTWGVTVPIAYVLANFTAMPIVPLYLLIQSLEFVKCVIGFILIKKGVWVRNIVKN